MHWVCQTLPRLPAIWFCHLVTSLPQSADPENKISSCMCNFMTQNMIIVSTERFKKEHGCIRRCGSQSTSFHKSSSDMLVWWLHQKVWSQSTSYHKSSSDMFKMKKLQLYVSHSSGAVWESRWMSWAVRPNEPSGFRGCKELLNRASALVTTCP